MSMTENGLAIDPSIRSLGYAMFVANPVTKKAVITFYGTLKPDLSTTQQLEIVPRVEHVINTLMVNLGFHVDGITRLDHLVIELPENWGAFKTLASAHSASLWKLSLLAHALIGWGIAKGTKVIGPTVSSYKGQLPKTAAAQRMTEKFGFKFKTNDESDAVYLADWYLTKEGYEVNA